MPLVPVAAVVFDLDGLMFNTEDLYDHVGEALLQRRGLSFTPELKQAMIGLPGKKAYQVMIDWHQLDATIDQLEQENDEVFAGLLTDHLQPMPGLFDLLELIEKRPLPKAIATSAKRGFAQHVLSFFQLEPRFEFILGAEDVVDGKPNPEIYLSAARRLQVDPAQMLVFEDSRTGALAAMASGAQVVAVPNQHTRTHAFDGVSLVADTLADPRIRSEFLSDQLP
ncbi:HAD family hydrolase [Lignipirellula cremea]|uniref:Phosphorylated carbohydrates phosphatase n=1 Tax=Lignipirellula cremea TaxID=2528010 RepID=A0A518E226_9BACT|nr:HAD family phosphatase [Lignipirellula cremea]QDU98112.1 Phosphorylated carbohydrates phosphatase [Lignipirellula cremea]